ncbi:MAG: YabP/YqfC family sporulation protein [Oscillospiraceae bacterium]|nr:YabP/YqfC family sporulation protein [Oscillospiraceae bacterium]
MRKPKSNSSDLKKQKSKATFAQFLEKQTDMPPISLSDIPYIEISGRNHIELDGVHKILEYKQERLKLRFRHCTVCFNGENLFIRNFSNKNAVIEGTVSSIEFE